MNKNKPQDIKEKKCKCCGGNIKIRNPKGCCDHLYYPENCNGNCPMKNTIKKDKKGNLVHDKLCCCKGCMKKFKKGKH